MYKKGALACSASTSYVLLEKVTRQKNCGWREVRYAIKGTSWHPAKDKLEGSAAPYGTPYDDSNNWSIDFSKMAFDQFLFTSGDKTKWLIANRD